MKKVFALLLAVMMMACVAFAEETKEELPEINFRGATLGATLGEVKDILECNVYKGSAWSYYNVGDILNSDISMLINGYPENANAERVILANEYLSVEDVAGYEPDMTSVYFVRPVIDGKLVTDDDSAIFYAGIYTFIESKEQTKVLYEDIANKLTSLYGEPQKDGSRLYWLGKDNTEIDLILNGTQFVRLSYVWLDAQALIDTAYTAVVNEPAVDNSTNTNGL